MRRTTTLVLLVVVLGVTACGSSTLSDEEVAYCRESMSALSLIDKGEELGVDITYVFDRGQEIFDSMSEDGDFEEAMDAAMDYTETEPNFVKVCQAAYEDR